MMFTNRFAKLLVVFVFCLAPLGCTQQDVVDPADNSNVPPAEKSEGGEEGTPVAPPA